MVTTDSLERLGRIARSAGAAILGHYRRPGAVSFKDDRSPLTEADRSAHRVLMAALLEWDPTIHVISEEGDIPPYEERARWERFWLVDPLDGTKEFLHQNDEFTVNVALVVGDAPVLGVVYAPALGLLYSAGRGLGAWKEQRGTAAIRVHSEPRPVGTPLVVAESRSHPSAELEAYLKTIRVERRIQVGSSLKFCWVAEGKADIYPRFGTTMEWDTAAGDCVYRYSGRENERFSTLRYNTPSLRNDHFIVGIQL
jgi:3'(2'), 5'-bisphosphate nucleotidase